jgi:hypothetical protein
MSLSGRNTKGNMPDINTKLKIAFVLVPVILLTGCGDKAKTNKQNTEAPSPIQSAPTPDKTTSSQAGVAAADPSPPITGAFGWTLGQTIPKSIKLYTNFGMGLSYPTSTNPPFEKIGIMCDNDRKITMIFGCTTNTNSFEYESLILALNAKYGVGEDTKPSGVPTRTWMRPVAHHQIQIRNNAFEGISVGYIDTGIFKTNADSIGL